MENPFKFGSIVEDEFFTDRVKEVDYVCNFINSRNHLVLISPRHFGKSSLVLKAVKKTNRRYVRLNLQKITSILLRVSGDTCHLTYLGEKPKGHYARAETYQLYPARQSRKYDD